MVLATAATTIGVIIAVVLIVGWLVYLLWNLRHARPEAGCRGGAGAQPQALPLRRGAGGAQARAHADLRRGDARRHRCRAAAVLDRASPAARPAPSRATTSASPSWGSDDFAHDGRRRVQLRRLPRRHAATGGAAPYTITDPNTGEVMPVNWLAPALNTVLYRFSEDEVRYILNYGRPVLADVAVGHRRRRPHERPADQERHRLPEVDPGADGGLRRGRDHLRRPATCRPVIPPPRSANAVRHSRRDPAGGARRWSPTASAASLGEALFNLDSSSGAYSLRPVPHQRAGPTATRSRAAAARWAQPHRRLDGAPVPERHRPRRVRRARARINGKRYGQQGQGSGPHARASASCSPRRRSRRSSTTSGGCDGAGHAPRSPSAGRPRSAASSSSSSGWWLLCGSVYLLLGHQPRRPPRLPRRAGGPVRVV